MAQQEIINHSNFPDYLRQLLTTVERIETIVAANFVQCPKEPEQFLDINGAAAFTSKSPNALRVQISLGNLKSIKKGSRHYFDRQYLKDWMEGTNEKGATK